MTIGYIAQMFPKLSETFVYREVQNLRASGIQVKTFSISKPDLSKLSDEAKDLVRSTYYIFPLNFYRFLIAHILCFFRQPHRYFGTLWFCLAGKHKTFKNRLRTFYHFCEAIPMAKEVRRLGIKHLHAHFALNPATVAMVVSRMAEVTFSFTAHANDIFCNPILLEEKIKAARFIIAISDYNKRFLYDVVPLPETYEKIHLVHCGIDIQNFSPSTDKSHFDKPLILAVGRIVEKKGYPYLIKACKILIDRGYNFNCFILGEGPQKSMLEQMVRQTELSGIVHIPGLVFQEDLRGYLNKTDIFVLPCIMGADQDMDGIPVTLMEAMAMEIPAVSTNISGIPELIENMKTGLLVPPKDEVSLAEAIAVLIQDKGLRSDLGQAAREKVVKEFEIKKNTNRLIDIFRSYLQIEAISK